MDQPDRNTLLPTKRAVPFLRFYYSRRQILNANGTSGSGIITNYSKSKDRATADHYNIKDSMADGSGGDLLSESNNSIKEDGSEPGSDNGIQEIDSGIQEQDSIATKVTALQLQVDLQEARQTKVPRWLKKRLDRRLKERIAQLTTDLEARVADVERQVAEQSAPKARNNRRRCKSCWRPFADDAYKAFHIGATNQPEKCCTNTDDKDPRWQPNVKMPRWSSKESTACVKTECGATECAGTECNNATLE
jgi:hypothetical protein